MKIKKVIFICLLSGSLVGARVSGKQKEGVYNVRDFGARGDGKVLDTAAIQKTIDECSRSGGRVFFPSGTFLSGTLFLKSGITLHWDHGATLLGSPNLADYPETVAQVPSYNDLFLKHSLLYAENCQDIVLQGPGLIDGQGDRFPVANMEKPYRYMNRPYILRFIRCKNVRVENLHMQNSAMWMQHYLACENLRLSGLTIYNHCNKNNDMVDIDGCRNVVMENCIADTDDDAITLKSTSLTPCENIVINNCIVSSHCNAVKCGTESLGGFKNITISNIVVRPSQHPGKISGDLQGLGGIVLTCVDGGVMDGIVVSNIRIVGAQAPIFIRLGNRGRTVRPNMPPPAVGVVKNISLSHIMATEAGAAGCAITGLQGFPVENVSLQDIRICFRGGISQPDSGVKVEEKPTDYPESTMFGVLPAYGLFVRHVRNLSMQQIHLSCAAPDTRPALWAEDVIGLDVHGFCGQGQNQMITLVDAQEGLLDGCRSLAPLPALISIKGANTAGIQINGMYQMNVKQTVQLGAMVDNTAVTFGMAK